MDGIQFSIALRSAIHRVISLQDNLNKINVFPVPDGDTGTNLSLSLGSALALLNSNKEKDIGRLATSLADVLLDGARGNSGAIVAQFFQGFSDAVESLSELNATSFATAIQSGSEYANDALSNPKEGTILSVIAAFSDAYAAAIESGNATITAALLKTLPTVDRALDNTTEQLAELKKAGVVDAGGKGFAELVRGLSAYLSTGEETVAPEHFSAVALEANEVPMTDFGDLSFRFCTECLVTGDALDRRKMREQLSQLGDSLVLAGSKRKAKIHIHVNEPNAVFDVAARFGTVSGQKTDDMVKQAALHGDEKNQFAVITDSAADIADEDMERLDIHMVPCRIQFGDKGYLDKVSITSDEFYDELRTNPTHPTTSQPAPGDFRRQFQYLASHYNAVLSINVSSTASGTHAAACSASKRIEATGKVQVVDSLNASVGQGQLVVIAAECAKAGYTAEQTLPLLHQRIAMTLTFALAKDLEFAVRGGRLPRWVKSVADALGLLPVLGVSSQGTLKAAGFLLGKRRRVERFAALVAKRVRRFGRVQIAIGHAVCPDEAHALQTELKRRIPNSGAILITELGTALGVHGGPGALVVAVSPYHSV